MTSPFPEWPATTWPSTLWHSTVPACDFAPVSDDTHANVLIVGAGFTGLWTAWHLVNIRPGLKITIVDAMQPGFGASGRNGGWCSALMPMSLGGIADRYGARAAIALQEALVSSVDDIGRFVHDHRIDCGWRKGGTLSVSRNPSQHDRAVEMVAEFRSFGFGEEHARILDADETRQRIACDGAIGGWYSPHCASLNPAQLLHGLVQVLLDRGVDIHGHTRVLKASNQAVEALTPQGQVRMSAQWVVRATEGFTASMRGKRRDLAPIHSYMVATAPLGHEVWSHLGWAGGETFADGRHSVIYAQRTADDRLAFGGRGAPYAFGSKTGPRFDTNPRIHDRIIATMHELFPATEGAQITHRWGGALGVPRDWFSGVVVNRNTGSAAAGGYVGDGVAFSQLAARSLANVMLDTGDPSARLAIVGHQSPRWEPEPFRWLGINGLLRVGAITDRLEARQSGLANMTRRILDHFVG